MGNTRLATTNRSGLSVAQVGGNDVYKLLPQVQSVIELGNFGEDYVKLFAEPVDNGRTIDWYVDEGNQILPLASLDEEKQKELLGRFSEKVEKLQNYAQSLRQKSGDTYRNYANILEKAMMVPDRLDSLYSVDGQPVLANWGFSRGDNGIVDGSQSLMKDIKDKLDEIKDNLNKIEKTVQEAKIEETPPPPPVEDAVPKESPEPQVEESEPLQPEAEPEPQPETYTPAPSSGHSWLLPTLVGAALVAAGAVLWWFLNNRAPDPWKNNSGQSLAWLKGDLNANGVLIDENNEAVDMTLHFEGEDGRGTCTIKSASQSCNGKVVAMPQANSRVSFAVSEVVCPNGKNFEPFSMICERGKNICTGTNQNGENWELKVNF